MRPSAVRPRHAGFSITELIVVMGIIAIMAALALPAIAQYMRVFKIRGAAEQVMQEIATARAKAIARNTNFGVLFIVLAPGAVGNTSATDQAYRYVLEDSWNGSFSQRQPTATLLTTVDPVTKSNPQVGPLRFLPFGIRFEAPAAGAVNDRGFRFDRLGSLCDPDALSTQCPALDAGTNLVYIDPVTTQAKLTLRQRVPDNGLAAEITVERGGRISVTGSWVK